RFDDQKAARFTNTDKEREDPGRVVCAQRAKETIFSSISSSHTRKSTTLCAGKRRIIGSSESLAVARTTSMPFILQSALTVNVRACNRKSLPRRNRESTLIPET